MTTRYEPIGTETEFEPGSRRRVLRNRLGIRSIREMERRESAALLRATEHMIDATHSDRRFSASDIRSMHRAWLGDIYEWAGEYRHVNLVKGGFMFAAADRVRWPSSTPSWFSSIRFATATDAAHAYCPR